jgi:hypothetical protein
LTREGGKLEKDGKDDLWTGVSGDDCEEVDLPNGDRSDSTVAHHDLDPRDVLPDRRLPGMETPLL